MSAQDPKKPEAPRPPSQPDPDSTGIFRWYQDLFARILPDRRNEKERPK